MNTVRWLSLLSLAASLALAACTLDFDRFQSGDGAIADGTGGTPPSDAASGDAPVEASDDGSADAAIGASGDGGLDASPDGGGPGPDADAGAPDVVQADASTSDANASDATPDGSALDAGLVAFYKFDETSGTSAADSSGNGHTAMLVGGATFAAGLQNNAVALSGSSQYVNLPAGIVSGLTSFSISTWVNLTATTMWSRVFDFGTGTTAYMFYTPNSGTTARYAISTGGTAQEQRIAPATPLTATWQHLVMTQSGNVGTFYVNGASAGQNTVMTVNPSSLGATTQCWLGRSEYTGDPYLSGSIDNFRIYNRALGAGEVQALYAGHL